MDKNFSPSFCADEEDDYIDMDLSFSSTNSPYYSPNSSPQSKDFEFQMSSISNDKGITTSSADELFYKGQLLPLHHPLRLKMVQKRLETSSSTTITTFLENTKPGFEEENHQETPFMTCFNNTSSSSVESCSASCELNPDKNFFERSAELSSFINEQHAKNSWSKKMKLMKPSILVQKLKASRACLKSLFCKSACNLEAENLSKFEESSNDEHIKITRKKPFGSMGKSTCPTMSIATITKSIDKEGIGNENVHRRSFSGAIKRHSATKRLSFSSSSSSSISSSGASSSSFSISGFQELYFLKRSSSATKIERSIEAAIAHCKKSQQLS
ncbi:probable membrane-associated kinase regulator 3 [Olea europaea var. sylvestris]|uniref:probable membrane-associated kinase regulator 3 n=1 Tax=Olea europaea var. sylvestris TaxID=158386 RepID=UPI000C1D8C9C|nr:probable membrane-associated kinase regulator 3 [Olea europaea var. sylvestris]